VTRPRHVADPEVDDETKEAICRECGEHVDLLWLHGSDIVRLEDEPEMKERPQVYQITILAPASTNEHDVAQLVDVLDAQAALVLSAMRDVVLDVELLIDDPLHPRDFEVRDCRCTGPGSWHCPGEESQHWAATSGICGHCGWSGE